jgi:DNA-binding MurR/RpiR family transcriptional regulator
MEYHTEKADRERLDRAIDVLTEENRRYFLGILEALAFAQSEQGQSGIKKDEKTPVCPV